LAVLCPGEGGLQRGEKFLAPPHYSQRAVFASIWALFSFLLLFVVFFSSSGVIAIAVIA